MSPPGKRSGPAANWPARKNGREASASASEHTPPACPDCAAVPAGRHLEHAATCPAARGLDAVTAADTAWFAAADLAVQRYTRPITQPEVVQLRIAGFLPDGWDAAGDVTVTKLAPGVRAWTFDDVWVFPLRGPGWAA